MLPPFNDQSDSLPNYSKPSLEGFKRAGGHVSANILIPDKQKAVFTPEVKPTLNLQLVEVDVRPPSHGEVVVRIAWTGLCGSDPMFCTGPLEGFPTHNHISGHEGIGHIVASHDASLLHRPVAARYLTYSCRHCKYCLEGLPESCPQSLAFSKDLDGTFQQYITVPVRSVIPLPGYVFDEASTVSPRIYAAGLCSGSAALKALRAARLRPGDVCVIVGIAGAVGHLAGIMAKNVYSAKVIGVDISSKAEDCFIAQGDACDYFVTAPESSAQKTEFQQKLLNLCKELKLPGEFLRRPNSLIACANMMNGYYNLTDYVCDGGTIVIAGGPSEGMISFPLQEILTRQIRIEGSLMGGSAEMYQCLEYIRSGLLKPNVIEISMEEIPQYLQNFKKLKNAAGKLVARINGPLN